MDNNLPCSGQKSDMSGNWLKMNLDLQVKNKVGEEWLMITI
jgi:hypothetical protein